jgi:ribonuclease-3
LQGPVEPRPLEEVIGYRFKNPKYLKEALSHKSFASESRSGVYNERLEFLGDSVLAAVVAHRLYVDYPDDEEGSLSKKKSQLVSRPSLSHWAAELNLGAYLYLGVGEETSGGRTRQSLLGNALEALIGAIYLDGGYEAAERFIQHWCVEKHARLEETDYKSRLQEMLQKKYKVPPVYELSRAAGPDHDKTFEVLVRLGKKELGKGSGKSKKEAEQSAARNALESLGAEA